MKANLITLFFIILFTSSAYPQQANLIEKRINTNSSIKPNLLLSKDIKQQNWLDNRNIFRDSYSAGKIFVDDFIYVFSSPARINKKSAILITGFAALGGIIYAYDQEIFDAINRNKNHKLYKPIRKLGENTERLGYMGFTNKFYFGAIALGYILKYEPLVIIPAEILEAHFIEGAGKNVLEISTGRNRPYQNKGPYYFKFNDGSSFPSGHSIVVTQVADIISYRVNYLPLTIAMYTIAGSVCLERITSSAHWPSDVYVGALYGWLVSHAILKKHDREMANLSVARIGNGVGLQLSFSF